MAFAWWAVGLAEGGRGIGERDIFLREAAASQPGPERTRPESCQSQSDILTQHPQTTSARSPSNRSLPTQKVFATESKCHQQAIPALANLQDAAANKTATEKTLKRPWALVNEGDEIDPKQYEKAVEDLQVVKKLHGGRSSRVRARGYLVARPECIAGLEAATLGDVLAAEQRFRDVADAGTFRVVKGEGGSSSARFKGSVVLSLKMHLPSMPPHQLLSILASPHFSPVLPISWVTEILQKVGDLGNEVCTFRELVTDPKSKSATRRGSSRSLLLLWAGLMLGTSIRRR
ncbi:hypothetical protein BDK51DRAFT_37505 [Blyttiomyces helicus]|uniref:Uncharacterized protein n=1 Tax=Blyttiomyces helicus TaxID=388810 RepID=A0A4P9W746_9FUNG|nr:hypothetical protein BDK51DRAFT_37505 [Blyttiomyces helicus]|eukprot:RKO87872.1 hypothetical protein BDK51DRAFT_37505 [Blyttiomyces helicus]